MKLCFDPLFENPNLQIQEVGSKMFELICYLNLAKSRIADICIIKFSAWVCLYTLIFCIKFGLVVEYLKRIHNLAVCSIS